MKGPVDQGDLPNRLLSQWMSSVVAACMIGRKYISWYFWFLSIFFLVITVRHLFFLEWLFVKGENLSQCIAKDKSRLWEQYLQSHANLYLILSWAEVEGLLSHWGIVYLQLISILILEFLRDFSVESSHSKKYRKYKQLSFLGLKCAVFRNSIMD